VALTGASHPTSGYIVIYNTAMAKGVPPHWNTLYLTSIFKKGDPHDAGNYRGISVMSFLPKVFALA
jgi:hypothetical protein